jgi:uncharacterized protein (TIGR03382 family)
MVSFKFFMPLAAVGACAYSASAGIVTVNQTFVNTTNSVQIFNFTHMLIGAQAIEDAVMGGAVSATVTDLNGNGATLMSVGTNAIYTALIGTTEVHTLMAGGFSFSVGQFLSNSVTPETFGDPIPSEVVPDSVAPGALGISLYFALTPGDAVSFASTFVVQQVPAPGMLPALAVLGLVGSRRRRA